MIKLMAEATVWYSCTLTEEDEQKVRKHMDENGTSLKESVQELFEDGEISIYDISHESDFSTEELQGIKEEDQ